MEGIYIIQNNDATLELAKDFVVSAIASDEYMANSLNQINKNLSLYKIINQEIFLPTGQKAIFPLPLYLKDKLGNLRESKIVKKLSYHEGIYEIRLDDNYEHHRIFFFLNRCILDNYLLSFGFTKNNNPNSDLTDLASLRSLSIDADLNSDSSKKNYWLGDEYNEFCEI